MQRRHNDTIDDNGNAALSSGDGSDDDDDSLREWAAAPAAADNNENADNADNDDDGTAPRQARPLLALDAEERELMGAAVHVRLHLPTRDNNDSSNSNNDSNSSSDAKASATGAQHGHNDRVVERVYYMGQSIEYIKMQLEELDGLPYERTLLYLHGTQLLDPLSLNDYAFCADAVNDVDVVVQPTA